MKREEILAQTQETYATIVDLRRQIHANPEMGNREFSTKDLIISCLKTWGVSYEEMLDTAVVATISNSGEKTVALRADMDALPINENTMLEFSSKNKGIMHACGHDLHVASLLGAIKILNQNKASLNGTVKFIFQPDEEGDGGAQRLIDLGVMNGVDKVFGIHVAPELDLGVVGVKYGQMYASSDVFEIDIEGKSSHGAEPQNGVDTVIVASEIVLALQNIVARNLAPTDSAVLTIGKLTAGTVRNAIAKSANLQGIIRTLGKEQRTLIKQKVEQIASGIATAHGAKAEVTFIESYDCVTNFDEETDFVAKCATELFGEKRLIVRKLPTMTSEDFGFYLNEAKGCFYHVGLGSEYPLHSDKLAPNEEAMLTLTAMHVKTVSDYLG